VTPVRPVSVPETVEAVAVFIIPRVNHPTISLHFKQIPTNTFQQQTQSILTLLISSKNQKLELTKLGKLKYH
jgi:hypothetical protein